jgi:hypothetical protein
MVHADQRVHGSGDNSLQRLTTLYSLQHFLTLETALEDVLYTDALRGSC